MNLTKTERLIIFNYLKILEKLYPDKAEKYANHRKAIERGFKIFYEACYMDMDTDIDIDDQELSEEDCQEVMDILSMFSVITNSYKKIKDEIELDDSIKFLGFDGNRETKLFAFTNYLIHDLGYYPELKCSQKSFNSHWPMVGSYRCMLKIWNSYSDRESLTEAQIKELLKAQKINMSSYK